MRIRCTWWMLNDSFWFQFKSYGFHLSQLLRVSWFLSFVSIVGRLVWDYESIHTIFCLFTLFCLYSLCSVLLVLLHHISNSHQPVSTIFFSHIKSVPATASNSFCLFSFHRKAGATLFSSDFGERKPAGFMWTASSPLMYHRRLETSCDNRKGELPWLILGCCSELLSWKQPS